MSNCIAVGGHAPTTAIPTGKFYGKLCVRSQTTNARFAVKFCQKGIQRGKRAELASASRSVVLFAACRVPRHAPWRSSRGPFPAPFPTLRRRVGPARDVDRADGLFKSLLPGFGQRKTGYRSDSLFSGGAAGALFPRPSRLSAGESAPPGTLTGRTGCSNPCCGFRAKKNRLPNGNLFSGGAAGI